MILNTQKHPERIKPEAGVEFVKQTDHVSCLLSLFFLDGLKHFLDRVFLEGAGGKEVKSQQLSLKHSRKINWLP